MAKSHIDIKLNSAGVVQLLKSQAVQNDLANRAARIQGAMPRGKGADWAVDHRVGFDRASVVVRANNKAARLAAAESPAAVLGAINAGG